MLAIVGPAAASVPDMPTIVDAESLVAKRYDARPGTLYLFRPDQHVAARWRRFDPILVTSALRRAVGHA
jgi:3-(3-hydroxy-phenyl)propionate hydroxylase